MTRLLGGIDLLDDSFRPIKGTEPVHRHFRYLEMGMDRTRFNFITLDHVDFGMRKQDFNLGAHAAFFFAGTPPLSGQGVSWRFRSDASYGRNIGQHAFLITRATGTTRIRSENRNAIFSDDTRFIFKLPTARPQTFVAHMRLDIGWDLDRDVQFLLDGQNGLRAYPNFSFDGSRRILFNFEHRIFLGRELLQMFEPGAAIFMDMGEAVNGGFRRHEIKTDFGIGLRCGIARLDTAMLRLDVSYALHNSPTSDRGIEISFATVQAF
jgi:hypothetical protein